MELLQMLGISRTTLREALRILEEQRLIRKRRGLGTFVMEQPIIKDMSRNFGITEMISQAGFLPGRGFSCRLEKPTKLLWKSSISGFSHLVVIERVRTAMVSQLFYATCFLRSILVVGCLLKLN
jgi:GntR family transcriptional regulator